MFYIPISSWKQSVWKLLVFSFCRCILYFTRGFILNTPGTAQQILCWPKELKRVSLLSSPPSHPQPRIWSFGSCRHQTFCAYWKGLIQSACRYAVSKSESTFLTPGYSHCLWSFTSKNQVKIIPMHWFWSKPFINPTNFAMVWEVLHIESLDYSQNYW